MAFEAYRSQPRGSTLAKRIVFVLVAVGHAAAIAAGVVYSYWHVDELTPPTLRVTFISAAPPPPPPPPPPPAGGGSKPKKVAVKTTPVTPIVEPKPTDIVQPRVKPTPIVKKEFRKHDDEEEDEDEDAPHGVKGGIKGGIAGGIPGGEVGGELGGVKGGIKGGVLGGLPAGTGIVPGRKMLGVNMGKLQWDNCVEPEFPISLRRVGVSYTTTVKICVSKMGTVETVTVLKKADSMLDANVVAAMKACKHKPLTADGMAVPFCYIQPFEFQTKR